VAASAPATAAATTASPTAAVAASTTTTTAAAAAKPAASASRPVFARLGFVDGQRAAVVVLAVERRDGRLSLLIGAHFHETESLAASGHAVADDFSALHGSVRAKQLLEFGAINVVAQIPHIQLLAHDDLLFDFRAIRPA